MGDGTTTQRATPVAVSGLLSVVGVAAGADHSLAVTSDGTVWAWGYNALGQLGDGTTTNRSTPVAVGGLTDVIGVSAGAFHSLAIRSDGTVWAWGYNVYGQLGDGTSINRTSPIATSTPSDVVGVAAGGYHSLFLANTLVPIAACQNIDRTLVDGVATVYAVEVDNGSSTSNGSITAIEIAKNNPPCDALTFTGSISYNCHDIGPQTVTLRVTQTNGQSACCTATVNISAEFDLDGNDCIGMNDISGFVQILLNQSPCPLLGDLNADFEFDGQDIQFFVDALLTSPPCP